ncbi:hypothetical protein GXW82_38910 [Streptacidiphilus sp. 4-A2]|nr:hypothetical protein [Streptacidiphilus sp. 4-A2]
MAAHTPRASRPPLRRTRRPPPVDQSTARRPEHHGDHDSDPRSSPCVPRGDAHHHSAGRAPAAPRPRVTDLGGLVQDTLPLLCDWLPRQRWFAGKGHPVTAIVPAAVTLLPAGRPGRAAAAPAAAGGAARPGRRHRQRPLPTAARGLPGSGAGPAGDGGLPGSRHRPDQRRAARRPADL